VIVEAIQKLVEGENLSEAEARGAVEDLMSGQASDAQIAGFLTALRMKGETPAELIAFARVMRERAEPFWEGEGVAVLDTCGTGGDRSGTFNISTAAAFVAAGAGARVAKHGNRSATSLCGSADVLEALGVDIQLPLERLRKAVVDVGFGFLFAQRFHGSMKHAMPARTQLKIRTLFNITGPLANPARPAFQVIGVASPGVMQLVADALIGLNARRAFVVHSREGLDEISISGPTTVLDVRNGRVERSEIAPADFGLPAEPVEALRGGDAATNAGIIESVLNGAERGPRRNVVVINAAAALVAAGLAASFADGAALAATSIDSGAAHGKLKALRELSQ
jgi:anthranilate phosphoribosyltransferase